MVGSNWYMFVKSCVVVGSNWYMFVKSCVCVFNDGMNPHIMCRCNFVDLSLLKVFRRACEKVNKNLNIIES